LSPCDLSPCDLSPCDLSMSGSDVKRSIDHGRYLRLRLRAAGER
jgi:hypothetical protein